MPNQNEEILQLEYVRMKKKMNGIIRQINALKEDQKRLEERLSRTEDMLESIKKIQQLNKSIRFKEKYDEKSEDLDVLYEQRSKLIENIIETLPTKYFIQLKIRLKADGAPSLVIDSLICGAENEPVPFQQQPTNGAIGRGGQKNGGRTFEISDEVLALLNNGTRPAYVDSQNGQMSIYMGSMVRSVGTLNKSIKNGEENRKKVEREESLQARIPRSFGGVCGGLPGLSKNVEVLADYWQLHEDSRGI
ncbi:unnamed protein product [Caenorhabditis angaria]|uniref:Uncharacterized protein n=1 Tax=Caenorhabditis angaria TaxID=860376 RepID=A0A9P1IQP9_9PELO|nr:unnamed protein product [Caenorhabditis angaria]